LTGVLLRGDEEEDLRANVSAYLTAVETSIERGFLLQMEGALNFCPLYGIGFKDAI
jgi:hypothetical protein